eukprot:GHVR01164950.1.p1 GENE.GHVR01164950.1~~GHVR01164950.1.p1  ORF type:complete len:180 (-),score=66.77 GHVR01164950.1:365-904(-)
MSFADTVTSDILILGFEILRMSPDVNTQTHTHTHTPTHTHTHKSKGSDTGSDTSDGCASLTSKSGICATGSECGGVCVISLMSTPPTVTLLDLSGVIHLKRVVGVCASRSSVTTVDQLGTFVIWHKNRFYSSEDRYACAHTYTHTPCISYYYWIDLKIFDDEDKIIIYETAVSVSVSDS